MRLNLHDFSGHPFQAQLSRHLAARGHEVVHTFSAQYVSGRGRLGREPGDPPNLSFMPITARAPMAKYSLSGRLRFELGYAAAWREFLHGQKAFDVVVSCNVPLLTAARLQQLMERVRQPWVLWHQDIYSFGMAAELHRILPEFAAGAAARCLERIEARQVAGARAVVAIDGAFLHAYDRWGVSPARAEVIPNWAPLDELTPRPRDNAWAQSQRLPPDPVRLLYSGTLGRKHNPLLLLDLLDRCQARGVEAHLTVVSEGAGADVIAAAAAERHDVRVLPYQPAEQYADVLGSADVLVGLLEQDAARYSIPSKVLSYLSAGRPIIGLMPTDNPAALDIMAAGGFVADTDAAGADRAAEWVLGVSGDRTALVERGRTARRLAEARFDIERITSRFEQILHYAATRASTPSPACAARPAGFTG